jgi:hypothetical protein
LRQGAELALEVIELPERRAVRRAIRDADADRVDRLGHRAIARDRERDCVVAASEGEDSEQPHGTRRT